jgi:hypothetical protein
MPNVDLNALRSRLKSRSKVAVNRDGTLDTRDPQNDGSKQGPTTLQPTSFYE